MTERFIVDTDVCINFLKGQEFAVTIIKDLLINGKAFLSILTYYELLKGAYSKKQEKIVKDFISGFEILNIDIDIVDMGARFYREYRKKGITLLLTALLWQRQKNMD